MLINLAFEGGGIKGLAYVGAMAYFEQRGYQVHNVAGSSVGAIFASLIACGYKAKEIKKIIDDITIDTIIEKNKVKKIIKDKGVYTTINLENKLNEILAKKGKRTFKDVKFGDDYLLKIVVTDWKSKKMLVLPNDLIKFNIDPDTFSIAKAAAISSSIPLFYSQYKIKDLVLIDGGISCNFPIDLVIDNNHPTYGLRLNKDESLILKQLRKKIDVFKQKDNKLVNIIYLHTYNLRANQFKQGLNMKEELYKSGYYCVKHYFEKKNR